MNNDSLHKVLEKRFGNDLVRQGHGRWAAVTSDGLRFQCMTDERANRMRFIIPVMPVGNAPKEFLSRLLKANFHSALDSRYAVANGLVWSTFLHPLRSLDEQQASAALSQVIKLASTTGSSYSSSDLVFVGMVDDSECCEGGRITAEEAFKLAEKQAKKADDSEAGDIPSHFCDPLTFELMLDPVSVPSGHTFERTTIMEHISRFHNNPFTREPLDVEKLAPNRALQQAIEAWQSQKP
eukprot:TRINITY_DN7971_c1_g1_i1.p1 TRINITY_DN7971_c1_g1~~TRINITY_DN7971_c1_g1_i1.p1  ORF type:complete len:253 (+),score=34.04 TRINITY_DN7971_c1_g1_i1:46-759(+)